MDIDAVITWVDGSDPVLAKKRAEYGGPTSFKEDDVAGKTRFASVGEIYWCVASIRKFAPFIRKIFIVTDGQDPHIPEGNIPVEIIDHKQIFKGYEQYLPVFNSISIETMTWRIPGLAEHYVELNDDFLICAPLTPEDFFTPEGNPVCYCSRLSIPFTKFTRAIKPSENGHRKVTFKGTQLKGALLGGARWVFYKLDHTPRPLLRSFFEKWFAEHPEQMERNISYRFRDPEQYSCQELHYVVLHKTGGTELRPVKGPLFYLEPKKKKDYVKKKMALHLKKNFRFCCFNSLDKASAEDFALVKGWIEEKIS